MGCGSSNLDGPGAGATVPSDKGGQGAVGYESVIVDLSAVKAELSLYRTSLAKPTQRTPPSAGHAPRSNGTASRATSFVRPTSRAPSFAMLNAPSMESDATATVTPATSMDLSPGLLNGLPKPPPPMDGDIQRAITSAFTGSTLARHISNQPWPPASSISTDLNTGTLQSSQQNSNRVSRTCSVPTTGLPASMRPPGHVSQCAVSLHWLMTDFCEEHPEIEVDSLTTIEVMQSIVMPATAKSLNRYVGVLHSRDPNIVSQGRPFFFISHVWARPFAELLHMLRLHFSPKQQRIWRRGLPAIPWREVFVWLDIFAVNQHPGDSQRNDLEMLKEVVADAEQTLMILDKEGTVLTRIWCLYEAWQTGRKGRGKLVMLSYGTKFEPLEKVFYDLDIASAKATNQDDLHRILNDIEHDVGVTEMGHDLKDALVESVVAEVPNDDEGWDKPTGYKLFKAARLCQLYGRLEQAEPLFRRNMVGSESQLGPDHPDTLICVSNLALLLHDQGRLAEAEPLCRRDLEGSERVLGPDHPGTLTSVGNLASLLKAQGKLQEAEPLYRRDLEGSERVLGTDHPETLISVNNLAALLQAQGKLEEAEPLYRRALEAKERVLGPYHPSTLTSVASLAGLLQAEGKLQEAERLYRRDLVGSERVLGPDHPDTLTAINNMAALLYKQGKFYEAEPLYRRALEAKERVLGPDHSSTLTAVASLAGLLRAQGKIQEAERLYRRDLTGSERVLGPDHPETLHAVNNLALLLKSMGQLKESEELYRRALESNERVSGLEAKGTLISVGNLAALLKAQGKLQEAEPLSRRALEGKERVFGPDHPETLISVNNLASLLQAQGKLEQAEPLYRRDLEASERVLGPDHPDTLTAVNNMAALLYKQGKLQAAEPLYRRALEINERVLGADAKGTLVPLQNLAGLLRAEGKLKEAEPLQWRALELSEHILGADHVDTLSAVSNVAKLLYKQGRLQQSLTLLQRTLDGRSKVLGMEHPQTKDTLEWMELLRETIQQEESADKAPLQAEAEQ